MKSNIYKKNMSKVIKCETWVKSQNGNRTTHCILNVELYKTKTSQSDRASLTKRMSHWCLNADSCQKPKSVNLLNRDHINRADKKGQCPVRNSIPDCLMRTSQKTSLKTVPKLPHASIIKYIYTHTIYNTFQKSFHKSSHPKQTHAQKYIKRLSFQSRNTYTNI